MAEQPTLPSNFAIQFEPDGYVLDGPKLMGRQAAGNAFLRAAIDGRGGAPMIAYTPHRRSAEVFHQLVKAQDPDAPVEWIPNDRVDLLRKAGALYLPGPKLSDAARTRLRTGYDAYSIVGVTHTTASHSAMDSIRDLVNGPVAPWDALICTSQAVAGTLKVILEEELAQLRWRTQSAVGAPLPQFPIIPLGVHCDDFADDEAARVDARAQWQVGPDAIALLFVGRLSFHAKAHPHQMYLALQALAEQTGKEVVLIQCGWFANEAIERAYASAAQETCPSVRMLFVDGKDPALRARCWAAADIFVSLSDNIQETFGLTPIEAMAAGLPVVVSDWDGYRDTVRDGIDGFRIKTWMPPAGLGEGFARTHEAGMESYDMYCGLTCQTVSLDQRELLSRLIDLASQPELRRRMGAAGRTRALEAYDWKVIYRKYKDLAVQLADIRTRAGADEDWKRRIAAAPRADAARLDPFMAFGHYATSQIDLPALVEVAPGASRTAYEQIAAQAIFKYAAKVFPSPADAERIFEALRKRATSVEALSTELGVAPGALILMLSILAKMDLVRLYKQSSAPQ
jgi:alpha-maltose-1-phosphate synthase